MPSATRSPSWIKNLAGSSHALPALQPAAVRQAPAPFPAMMFGYIAQDYALGSCLWGDAALRSGTDNSQIDFLHHKNTAGLSNSGVFMAEKEGFEPSIPFWGIHDFQSCALGQLRDFSMTWLRCQPGYNTIFFAFCQPLILFFSAFFRRLPGLTFP